MQDSLFLGKVASEGVCHKKPPSTMKVKMLPPPIKGLWQELMVVYDRAFTVHEVTGAVDILVNEVQAKPLPRL